MENVAHVVTNGAYAYVDANILLEGVTTYFLEFMPARCFNNILKDIGDLLIYKANIEKQEGLQYSHAIIFYC